MTTTQTTHGQAWPLLRAALLGLVTLATTSGCSAAEDWSVSTPRGETRLISFETSEATWSSVDMSADGRWLVFDMLGHIYRVSVDGGEATCLTQDSGIALNYHPRISPDGREIAFVSDRLGQDNLWIMNADGSNPRIVFEDLDSRATEPAWSPDGESIFITRRLKTPFGFYRVDDAIWAFPREGGAGRPIVGRAEEESDVRGKPANERQITTGHLRYQWPAVSPDGVHVYFNTSTFDGDDKHIQRINLQSAVVETVIASKLPHHHGLGTDTPRNDRLGAIAPEVSPDGKWLAFVRKLPAAQVTRDGLAYEGRSALWLRDLQTGQERVLLDPVEPDAMDGHPTWKLRALPGYDWAPDSESVVISVGGKIRRAWLEGGRVETIPFTAPVRREISEMARGNQVIESDTFTVRAARWPAVSPNGQSLLFEAGGRLWLKDLQGGEVTALLPDGDYLLRSPAWSPDSQSIAYVEENNVGQSHLWLLDRQTGERRRVTSQPAHYLDPSWTADGSRLIVNQWPGALDFEPSSAGWNLLSLALDGTPPTVLAEGQYIVRPGAAADGRIYFTTPAPGGHTSLASYNADGGDRLIHATFAGSLPALAVSLDGNHLAVQRSREVWVLPLPAGVETREDALMVDVAQGQPESLVKISTDGGFDPHWQGTDQVAYLRGSQRIVVSLRGGERRVTSLGLELPRAAGRGVLALTNAQVLTMRGGRDEVLQDASVVIENARIRCVGDCDTGDAARVIDLEGRTIMPGWVDTHAHNIGAYDSAADLAGMSPMQRSASAAYLAYGVTTTYDPAASDKTFHVGELTASGKIVGPRTFSSGPTLTCDWADYTQIYGTADDFLGIETYADADREISRLAAQGAISIKDYRQCTRFQRQMLAEAARRHNVSITTENGDLMYILGQVMNGHTGWEHPLQYHVLYDDVLGFFGRSRTHYSADLILADYPPGESMDYWYSDSDLLGDEKLLTWLPQDDLAARRRFIERPVSHYSFPWLAVGAQQLAQRGVLPTIGAHGELHGKGPHFEVWLHAEASSPLEAIRYATYNGAHFLGLDTDLGSLEEGKLADLVVLDADPLENIRNSETISRVMKNGVLYEADTLDQIWPDAKPYGPRPWRIEYPESNGSKALPD